VRPQQSYLDAAVGPTQENVVDEESIIITEGNEWFVQRDNEMTLRPCSLPIPDSLSIDSLAIIWSGEITGICPNVKGQIGTRFSKIKKL